MNPESMREPYHHGNLEHALLDAALRSITVDGLQKLSLRQLAKEIGVSHNAPYQHFPDKESLIAALAERGFQQLGEAIDEATATRLPSDPVARLIAVAQCYVAFMAQNPAYMDVMFGSFPHMDYATLSGAAIATLDKLVALVVEGQHHGVIREGDAQLMAGAVWSMVHGISGIFIARKFAPIAASANTSAQLTAELIGFLCDGLRK